MSDTLSVSEAATVAGVSVRTVRRWIASGQVVTRGHGHGRRVVTSSLSKQTANSDTNVQEFRVEPTRNSATTVTSDTGGHEADRLAALVSELTVRLADQAALIAIWQERARVLSDRLALKAPEPPQEAQPAPEPTPMPAV